MVTWLIKGRREFNKMHYRPNIEERKYLRQIVSENKVWIKNAREGPASLMRALSSALYFTEARHKEIQIAAINFVLENYHTAQLKSLKQSDSDTIRRFVEHPELPEFSNLNIEAVSMAYQTRIKLFYVQNDNFCSQIFYKKTSKSCSIFRFNELFYASVFDKQYKQLASIAQNFVLSIVDTALEGVPFEYRNVNNGHFINYDYSAGASCGLSPKKDDSEQSNFFDYSFNKSEKSINDLSYSFRVSESNSTHSNSVGFFMEGLSSLLRNRHGLAKESNSETSENQHAPGADFLRKKTENAKRADESKQTNKELADFSIFAEPESVVSSRNKFSTFANKVMSENNNLQREVTVLPMSNLFGFINTNPSDQSMLSKQNQSILEQAGGLLFGDDDATLRDATEEFQIHSDSRLGIAHQVNKPSILNQNGISPIPLMPIPHSTNKNSQFSIMNNVRRIPENPSFNLEKTVSVNNKAPLQSITRPKESTKHVCMDEPEADLLPHPKRAQRSSMDLNQVFEMSGDGSFQIQYNFDPNLSVHEGILAYYDEKRGFGIIQPEKVDLKNNKQGIFVFRKELQKAGINVRALSSCSHEIQFKLAFQLERISDFSAQRTRAVNIARLETNSSS